MEELDADAHQRRETFARYGLAMYHAQCVEKSLAILVSSIYNKDFLTSTPNKREEIQDESFDKTIGRLLTRMRKQITIPPNLNRSLDDARYKRNWLAHEYFWVRAGELMTTHGREKMIDELTELSEFFSRVDSHLTSIYDKWVKKIGVTQQMIDKNLKDMTKENNDSSNR